MCKNKTNSMTPPREPGTITVTEFFCLRCKKFWWPRIKNGKITPPKCCFHCNSPYWNRVKTKF